MKLELKCIIPYLPYKLKVQYKGILNGKELGEWDKKHKDLDLFEDPEYPIPKEIIGLKTGYIKEVGIYLNHTKYRIGTKGLQTHYNTEKFKLILIPLSELNKPQWLDVFVSNDIDNILEAYRIDKSLDVIEYYLVEMLIKNHFDVFGLIEKGLAINKNTL